MENLQYCIVLSLCVKKCISKLLQLQFETYNSLWNIDLRLHQMFRSTIFSTTWNAQCIEPHTYELCRFSLMYTQSEHIASFLFSFERNTNTWKRVVQPHEDSNSEQRLLFWSKVHEVQVVLDHSIFWLPMKNARGAQISWLVESVIRAGGHVLLGIQKLLLILILLPETYHWFQFDLRYWTMDASAWCGGYGCGLVVASRLCLYLYGSFVSGSILSLLRRF